MAAVATTAYAVFGTLAKDNEFSVAAIWVSLALTTFSVLYGIVFLGDAITLSRCLAFVFALAAAYLSVQTTW